MTKSSDSKTSTDAQAAKKPRPKRSWTYVAIAGVAAAAALAVLLIDPNSFNPEQPVERVEFPRPPIDELPPRTAQVLSQAFNVAILTPEDGDAWGRLGMTYYAHELIPQSLVCFEQAEKLNPKDARWPYLYGMVASESNRADGLPGVERAVALEPDDVAYRTRLAEFLFTLDRFDESREQFNKVRESMPDDARVLLGLARLAFAERDWKSARELGEQAVKAAPNRPDIRELMSQVCFRLGDKDAAKTHADVLAQLQGVSTIWGDKHLSAVGALRSDPDVLLEQAGNLGAEGRVEEQLQLLDRLVQVDPDNPDGYIQFARALLRAGNLPAASQVVAMGATRHPKNAELLLMKAITLLQIGKVDDAIAQLKRVIERKPDYAEAYFILGNAFMKQEKKQEAMEAFRNVLRYEPLFAPAKKALAELE